MSHLHISSYLTYCTIACTFTHTYANQVSCILYSNTHTHTHAHPPLTTPISMLHPPYLESCWPPVARSDISFNPPEAKGETPSAMHWKAGWRWTPPVLSSHRAPDEPQQMHVPANISKHPWKPNHLPIHVLVRLQWDDKLLLLLLIMYKLTLTLIFLMLFILISAESDWIINTLLYCQYIQ